MSDEEEGLLTVNDICDRFRVHRKSVDQMMKDGRIPPPVEGWGGSERRWLKSEIVAHIRGMRKRELAEQVK